MNLIEQTEQIVVPGMTNSVIKQAMRLQRHSLSNSIVVIKEESKFCPLTARVTYSNVQSSK